MEDIWKPIKGHIGVYWINSKGEIKNAKGLYLKPTQTKDGTLKIDLRSGGQRQRHIIKNLVIDHFEEENNE